jgi:hypothetical protein
MVGDSWIKTNEEEREQGRKGGKEGRREGKKGDAEIDMTLKRNALRERNKAEINPEGKEHIPVASDGEKKGDKRRRGGGRKLGG